MRTLPSLLILTLLGACSALAAQTDTQERTPPLLEEYRVESFKRYRTPDRPTDGYEMEFPYQFATWKLTRLATRDKDDKRDDICLIGARPTMVIVPGWYLRFNMASKNSKPTDVEQVRHDTLRTLFKELEEHAKANKKDYDVLVLFPNQNDDDREAILEIYNESKPEYIELAEAALGFGKNDNNASNYWGNLIQTPDKKMVTNNATAPSAVASWVWMPKPGIAEAWGVWGFDSEAKRLKKFVKDTETPKALKISNSDHREIADMLAHWRLGDAEKQIEKLEKKAAKSDARNIELLREFEKQLEEAYREGIAGVHKRAGYLVEYADAMTAFAETYYTKKSTRGGEILDEIKAFKKTDEYEHVEDAKKAFDKLSDSIYSQLNGGLHGDAYAKHHTAIMKKHKSSIEKFNKEFGDTPYAETTRKWGEEASSD